MAQTPTSPFYKVELALSEGDLSPSKAYRWLAVANGNGADVNVCGTPLYAGDPSSQGTSIPIEELGPLKSRGYRRVLHMHLGAYCGVHINVRVSILR